jgi:hypothetical protein
MKNLKIKIDLMILFLKWTIKDIRQNYQDIKLRYLFMTDPELHELQMEIRELMKKITSETGEAFLENMPF